MNMQSAIIKVKIAIYIDLQNWYSQKFVKMKKNIY